MAPIKAKHHFRLKHIKNTRILCFCVLVAHVGPHGSHRQASLSQEPPQTPSGVCFWRLWCPKIHFLDESWYATKSCSRHSLRNKINGTNQSKIWSEPPLRRRYGLCPSREGRLATLDDKNKWALTKARWRNLRGSAIGLRPTFALSNYPEYLISSSTVIIYNRVTHWK